LSQVTTTQPSRSAVAAARAALGPHGRHSAISTEAWHRGARNPTSANPHPSASEQGDALSKHRKINHFLTAVAAASAALLLCASNASAADWQLTNAHSGRCLAVANASTANAAGVIQWTCNGGSEQEWNFVPASGIDYYTLHNAHSGQCLAIGSASTAQGGCVQSTADLGLLGFSCWPG
jgi:hypothetical protein